MNKYKRNTRSNFFYLSLIFYGTFILTANAHCAEWISLGENSVGHFFYDKTSISKTDNGMIIIDWTQIVSIDAAKSAASN